MHTFTQMINELAKFQIMLRAVTDPNDTYEIFKQRDEHLQRLNECGKEIMSRMITIFPPTQNIDDVMESNTPLTDAFDLNIDALLQCYFTCDKSEHQAN